MKKLLVSFLIATGLLTGCATADFKPYEGKNITYEGNGGTKVVADGVDFWANGSPPRKYKILGVVTSEVGTGIGDESMIYSAVASEVKKNGGDAAIEMTNNTSFAGIIKLSPTLYTTTSVKRVQFSIVKYVSQ